MKNKLLPILILLLFLVGCKSIFNTKQEIESPSINIIQSSPIVKETNLPSVTPLKTQTNLPFRTITPQSSSNPQMAHWIINSIGEQVIVYVLGNDLKIINQFSKFLGDAFVDSQNCQIIKVSSHIEKQTGLHDSLGFDIEWLTLAGNQIKQKLIKYPTIHTIYMKCEFHQRCNGLHTNNH